MTTASIVHAPRRDTTMTAMTPAEAQGFVACHVVAACIQAAGDMWESYPGISENDWAEVGRLVALLAFPDPAEYDAAYKLLAARANHA